MMIKTLVAYFSATGTTATLAKNLSKAIGAELYEIKPEVPYTSKDLDWKDETSRSSIEMDDPTSRPALAGKVENMDQYDCLFIGFPIWWHIAPRIINSFLEQYDLSGKKIIPFATSGSSGIGDTNTYLAPSCKKAILKEGKRFPSDTSIDKLKAWAKSI